MAQTVKLESRKLTQKHRSQMFQLAKATLIEPDLRQAYLAAQSAAVAAIMKQLDDRSTAEMQVLEKFKLVAPVTAVTFCGIRVKVGTKKFVVDGKTITRDELKTIKPTSVDTYSKTSNGVGAEISYWASRQSDDEMIEARKKYRFVVKFLDGESRLVPINTKVSREPEMYFGDAEWWNEDVWVKARAMYEAGHALAIAEGKLLRAAAKMITAAKTYGDMLAAWPEVKSIEIDLFGVPPTDNAIVALSDEDRAILCNHMGRRGLTSAACDAARSPAYAEAAE
ncbi:hypothetical protein F1188_16050 [Roseospira marina]|uniref:Uncharacterized protein n=1 Tax=Roseospira marina TaxID=140057 RepID=A0A5M6I877_9PROT|nr:hypothetical protein [Roseospira marina]KAA5604373.1 hypothetical protein F1188_16050 [Roseospira marina]MBB4315440.1 hypothetical protein [Roseospira marina]MBB5088414.1 hypothetical protein [Roseospira marina]